MDSVSIVRIVAGVLFVIVLGILVQRRRSRVQLIRCLYGSSGGAEQAPRRLCPAARRSETSTRFTRSTRAVSWPGKPQPQSCSERTLIMDSTTLIRIVSGVLFVIVLGILIQRRRTKVR